VGEFDVIVGAGSFRSTAPDAVRFPHRWTTEGVTVEAAFTGAHLLHLAAAGCVLNDVYREAKQRDVPIDGVRGFDAVTWQSTGIDYVVELDSSASQAELDAVLDAADSTAEIPKSIRAGASVQRLAE
jgi:hypothetical protein